jgi:hypothetical protein
MNEAFFTIGEPEARSFKSREGFTKIMVQVVQAATDHVGDIFLLRESGRIYRGCGRCGGYGHYSYNQFDGTICFDCRGHGLGVETTFEQAEALIKSRRANRNRRARNEFLAAQEVAIAWNAFWDEAADVIEWLSDKDERTGFVGDIARKVSHLVVLTENQLRAIRKIIRQDAEKVEKVNTAGHFGEVGKREAIEVTIKSAKFIESDFGGTVLVIMESAAGHVLKTFSAGEFGSKVEVGTTVTVKATVKTHGEYNGVKETMVTRVALAK